MVNIGAINTNADDNCNVSTLAFIFSPEGSGIGAELAFNRKIKYENVG